MKPLLLDWVRFRVSWLVCRKTVRQFRNQIGQKIEVMEMWMIQYWQIFYWQQTKCLLPKMAEEHGCNRLLSKVATSLQGDGFVCKAFTANVTTTFPATVCWNQAFFPPNLITPMVAFSYLSLLCQSVRVVCVFRCTGNRMQSYCILKLKQTSVPKCTRSCNL